MSFSKLDRLYRTILMSKFFIKGWGDPEAIKRLIELRHIVRNRETLYPCVPKDCPIIIDKETSTSDCIIMEGHFRSPFIDYLPNVVPKESETAYFQMLLPKKWKTNLKPVCLFLAGTGDHHFWRRRNLLAKPLLKEGGIGSIILENPFYLNGLRKPKDQVRSSLHNVSDIFVMGGCLAFESSALFHWCEKQGLGPLGVSGISMGGHMASIAACVWPRPIALIPCLSWTTASCVFTQGVMSDAVPWSLLEDQYFSKSVFREELRSMLTNFQDVGDINIGQKLVNEYSDMKSAALAHFENAAFPERSKQDRTVLNIVGSQATLDNNAFQGKFGANKNAGLSEFGLNKKTSHKAAIQFMKGIMDEFTHLSTFSRPVDPNLIIIVVAKSDAYVLRDGITDLRDIWPGAEVRYIDVGHIAAFLFKRSVFRKAIIDAFDRLTTKYYADKLIK